MEEACGFGKQLCCSVDRRLKTNLSKQETMAGVNKCAECEHNKIKKRNGNNRLGSLNDQMFCSVPLPRESQSSCYIAFSWALVISILIRFNKNIQL